MRELEDRVEVERAEPLRMRSVETAALEYLLQRLRYMR